MPKQVIDITTPEEEQEDFEAVLTSSSAKTSSKKKVSKKKKSVKAVKPKKEEGEIKVERIERRETEQPKKKERIKVSFSFSLPKLTFKLPLFILIFLLACGGTFVYLTLLANAEINIRPTVEPIKIEDEIQISVAIAQVDAVNKIIPGQIIEKEAEKWATFSSTGTGKEQFGASGTIFVYNNINPPTALNLKEGTRFVSSQDGKIYKSKGKISLPAAKLENGKAVPSITEVEVVAQQEGEGYNIAPAKFSVPGLAGTTLYYSIWGESRENIEGGSEKEIKQITEQDMNLAKSGLTDSLKTELTAGLRDQVSPGFYLSEEAVDFTEPEISCSQEVGAVINEFNCYAKIKAKSMVFKEADLRFMAKSFIESKLSIAKKLEEQSLSVSVNPKGGVTESGNLAADLKIEANFYDAIDIQRLIGDLAGKTKDEMSLLLKENYPQIEKIDVKLWPFWIKKAPKNIEKVNAKVVF